MTLYEYRCRECGRVEVSAQRADAFGYCAPDDRACPGRLRRVWGFQQAPQMVEHLNRSTGTVVSSQRQFERDLRRASDAASERSGIEHRFVPVDPSDRKALGVTDAGLEATNRARRARGEATVPLADG